jgi:hypothetical protein
MVLALVSTGRRQHKSLGDGARCTQRSTSSAHGPTKTISTIVDRRGCVAEPVCRPRHDRAQEADLIYEAVNLSLGIGEERQRSIGEQPVSRDGENIYLLLTV